MSRDSRLLRSLLLGIALVIVALLPRPSYGESAHGLGRGRLLVARESLRDPNFARTVLLILSYDESGAAAVVLNRRSHMRIDHLLPNLDLPAAANREIFIGGPVAVRHATILATAAELRGAGPEIIDGVRMTADLGILERMALDPQPGERFRVYAGHAGWGPGQLEDEMRRRSWYVLPAAEATIFTEDDGTLWETLIRRTRSRIAMR
jgi:putative transcriptional regulator